MPWPEQPFCRSGRSEEHTSELQSLRQLVCRLLLEKKKTQGGESEWNSAAASADETRATLYQDLEIPRGGEYRFWVRYADWAKRSENFTVTIAQDGAEVFRHEFGAKDLVDPHDELSMYWSWAFTWDSASVTLK